METWSVQWEAVAFELGTLPISHSSALWKKQLSGSYDLPQVPEVEELFWVDHRKSHISGSGLWKIPPGPR